MLMLSFVYAQMAYNGAGLEKYDRLNRCLGFQRLPDEIVDRRMREMVGFHARTALSIHEGHYCVIEAALDDLMAVQIDNDGTKPFSGNMALDLDERQGSHQGQAPAPPSEAYPLAPRQPWHAVLPLRRRARGVQGVAREHLSFAPRRVGRARGKH